MTSNFFSKLLKKDAPPAKMKFGVGAVIEKRYRLDSEIGRGGMGIVYRAHDLSENRDVAIKVINLDQANILSRQQFSRESEIMSKLHHPHIINVFAIGTVDAGKSKPSPFIAMELVQGKGLDELRGLTYARIIDLAKQICEALDYAHSQGYVHRDLKPANVLLEKQGFRYFAKLADFGLARPLGESNLPFESNIAGTVFYLAPEVITGQRSGVSSDLYALGAMMYEMITGRVPFSDFIDDAAILTQHVNEPVAPPSQSRSDVPPALETIVLHLLEKNPNDRFKSAKEVLEALGKIDLASESAVRGNFPDVQFHADENEIARVKQLLEVHPLVTLIGRDDALALAVGAQLVDPFHDGVWLVKLDAVSEPSLVLPTIASALGIREDQNRPLTVALIESLREKHLLLILSRCDHVLYACAQFAETIVRTCPEVRILTTSENPLALSIVLREQAGVLTLGKDP